MDKYVFILSKTYGCYKMKKLLPKRFHNVDLKNNNEYKKWKKAEDEIFENKCWWDSLDKYKRKEYVDKYGYRNIE
jgi:hypothetical protein